MNWHALPHSEFIIPGLVLLVLGLALLTLSFVWPDRVHAVVSVDPVESGPLLPRPELTGAVSAFTREVTWPALIDAGAGPLSEAERSALVEGFALIGGSWTGEILSYAFDQETGPLRVAVIEALAFAEGERVLPTLERAYASYAVDERFAAIDAASRRGDVALLERGLRDTDESVALAAAYGLHRARRNDLIEAAMVDRTDARAAEIRSILPLLQHTA